MARKLLDALVFFSCLIKEEVNMVDMYLALVLAGRRTCDPNNTKVAQVHPKYRAAVLVELAALNLDANGDPI